MGDAAALGAVDEESGFAEHPEVVLDGPLGDKELPDEVLDAGPATP